LRGKKKKARWSVREGGSVRQGGGGGTLINAIREELLGGSEGGESSRKKGNNMKPEKRKTSPEKRTDSRAKGPYGGENHNFLEKRAKEKEKKKEAGFREGKSPTIQGGDAQRG